MYRRALTISRNGTVAGRPGPLPSRSRSRGSSTAHWASVRSLGYARRPPGAGSGTTRVYVAIGQPAPWFGSRSQDYTNSRTRSKRAQELGLPTSGYVESVSYPAMPANAPLESPAAQAIFAQAGVILGPYEGERRWKINHAI